MPGSSDPVRPADAEEINKEYYYRVMGVNGGSQSEGEATILAAAPWDQAVPMP